MSFYTAAKPFFIDLADDLFLKVGRKQGWHLAITNLLLI